MVVIHLQLSNFYRLCFELGRFSKHASQEALQKEFLRRTKRLAEIRSSADIQQSKLKKNANPFVSAEFERQMFRLSLSIKFFRLSFRRSNFCLGLPSV